MRLFQFKVDAASQTSLNIAPPIRNSTHAHHRSSRSQKTHDRQISGLQPRHRFVRAGEGNQNHRQRRHGADDARDERSESPAIDQRGKRSRARTRSPASARCPCVIDIQAPAQAGGTGATEIRGVKHVIAVASGKGGVGKSTVAANLAVALQQDRRRASASAIAISTARASRSCLARNERPMATEENRIIPIERYGLEAHVDGLPARRCFARHPPRTDGHALHAAISPAGRVGRPRLPRARSAAGHGRHPADHRPDRRARRGDHRHHAAGSRADRRPQSGHACSQKSTCPCSGSSKT